MENSSGTIRLRLLKERWDSGFVQGETLSGEATTPSATPAKKSQQLLGEARKRSMEETIQGSGSNSTGRFIGLVLWVKAEDVLISQHWPLCTSKDLRITQREEEKQTAAVKTGGDGVGKRNHPQWGHLLVRGCKLKAGLYFCPMPAHFLSQNEVGAGELRRRWAQQHGAVLGPAHWIWTLAVVVWIYKGIKKPKLQWSKALKYSVITSWLQANLSSHLLPGPQPSVYTTGQLCLHLETETLNL